jgi:hypothetical protein
VGEDSSTTSNMACTPTPGRHSRSSALAHRRFACLLEAGQGELHRLGFRTNYMAGSLVAVSRDGSSGCLRTPAHEASGLCWVLLLNAR